jgi:hypothetical protein
MCPKLIILLVRFCLGQEETTEDETPEEKIKQGEERENQG